MINRSPCPPFICIRYHSWSLHKLSRESIANTLCAFHLHASGPLFLGSNCCLQLRHVRRLTCDVFVPLMLDVCPEAALVVETLLLKEWFSVEADPEDCDTRARNAKLFSSDDREQSCTRDWRVVGLQKLRMNILIHNTIFSGGRTRLSLALSRPPGARDSRLFR